MYTMYETSIFIVVDKCWTLQHMKKPFDLRVSCKPALSKKEALWVFNCVDDSKCHNQYENLSFTKEE